jgi:hypothetical protein
MNNSKYPTYYAYCKYTLIGAGSQEKNPRELIAFPESKLV